MDGTVKWTGPDGAPQSAKLSDLARAAKKRPKTKADPEMDAASAKVSADEAEALRDFIERLHGFADDREALAEAEKAVLKEAKAAGFGGKALKRAAKILRMDPDQRAALESVEETARHYLDLFGAP